MKIGILTQWYPPEPAFIPASLAEELTARGHQVRVLTGYPNYPDGKIYPGYRQRWGQQSNTRGVRVRRVPLYPSHDRSLARRAANYLSFGATSSLAALRYLAQADVLYVYHPPLTTFAPAALLRLLNRMPAVLHVQDVWPDAVTSSSMAPRGARRLVHGAIAAAMRGIYRAASSIAVIAPSMRDLVVERGADADRVQVVLNWTDEDLFRPVPITEQALRAIGYRGRCTIMYAGNIGPLQDVAGAVQAAAAADGQVDLVLVGSGTQEGAARALAEDLRATNVRFLGRYEPAHMAPLYGAADFQLISLRDVPALRGTIPSKLQAALSCGSPVVASAAGDCAELVERDRIGLSCPPENWPELARRFCQAAALSTRARGEMGQRAHDSYRRHMSRQAGVDRLEAMLEAAVRERGRR